MGTDDVIYSVEEERDIQINEMAITILNAIHDADYQISYKTLATVLYDSGYRKQEDKKEGTDDERT